MTWLFVKPPFFPFSGYVGPGIGLLLFYVFVLPVFWGFAGLGLHIRALIVQTTVLDDVIDSWCLGFFAPVIHQRVQVDFLFVVGASCEEQRV